MLYRPHNHHSFNFLYLFYFFPQSNTIFYYLGTSLIHLASNKKWRYRINYLIIIQEFPNPIRCQNNKFIIFFNLEWKNFFIYIYFLFTWFTNNSRLTSYNITKWSRHSQSRNILIRQPYPVRTQLVTLDIPIRLTPKI